MKVRAITIGTNLVPLDDASFARAAEFCNSAKIEIEQLGIEVQSLRIAGSRLNPYLKNQGTDTLPRLARQLEISCIRENVDYCCLGCIDATGRDAISAFNTDLSLAVSGTEKIFAFILAASRGNEINKAAILDCARTVLQVSGSTPEGFGCMRLAVGANIVPNAPFFPASYHDGGLPSFSLALEVTDIAAKVFNSETTAEITCNNFITALEENCRPLEETALKLESRHGIRYRGLDMSLAPFPAPTASVAGAIEAVGGGHIGSTGTLTVVHAITKALKKVSLMQCGFSGVMLPVLEDSVLGSRVEKGGITLDQLLLFSAVCGTGLDLIPLPGDISEGQLGTIILDVCSLSLATNKPLTARLMPVPGKIAGEYTSFHSPYFINTRIMPSSSGFMHQLLQG